MPTWRDKAIVLRKRSLRDADRHYVVFTEGRGKVTLLAKGSRRGKSKMAPHLASFGVVELMAANGRIIDRLAGASLVRSWRGIFGSLPKMSVAQSFLLAVDALTKRELPETRIFRLLEEFMEAVDGAPDSGDGRTTVFDAATLKLFELLGLAVELDSCVRCRRPVPPQGNALNLLSGGLECPNCRAPSAMDVSAPAIEVMRRLRLSPLAVAAIAPTWAHPTARREVAFIVDLALALHLESRLPALKYLKAVA